MKYYYKDSNGKTHYTKSEFVGWHSLSRFEQEPLFFATFKNQNHIRFDQLEPETIKMLPPLPELPPDPTPEKKHNYMTVRELVRQLLLTCKPNDIVLLSSDGEGNSYAPMSPDISL